MKNKRLKKTIVLLTTLMMLTFVVADTVNISALSDLKKAGGKLIGKTMTASKKVNKASNDASAAAGESDSSYQNVTKDETVYVITDSEGTQNDVIVSDHLKNKSQLDNIKDKSNLRNIENVKGDEKFSRGKNGNLTWKANGNDIYYQGRTSKEAPVQVDISYKLDGVDVSGEELQGKSGEVEIEISYESMPVKKSDGSKETVPFLAISGMMAENSNFYDVTVDGGKVIDDGEKTMIACMGMPGFFEGDSVSVGGKAISNTAVVKGTAKKFNVTDIMTVVTNDFLDDIDTDALGQLNGLDAKIDLLDSSAKKLVAGSNELYKGLKLLNGKTSMLASGIGELASGSEKVKTGTGQLSEATAQLKKATATFSAKLSESLGSMKSGVYKLETGATGVSQGIKNIQAGINGGGTAENPGLAAGAESVASGASGLASKLGTAKETLGQTSGALDQAMTLIKGMINDENLNAEQKAKLNGALEALAGSKKGQDAVKDGIDLASINKLAGGASSVSDGLKNIQAGINGGGTAENPGLAGASGAVASGVSDLKSGLEKATAKTDSLTAGAAQIASGTSKVAAGQTTLYEGAQDLADGMMQMDSQKGALVKGVSELKSGSGILAQGLAQFYSEGISVLVKMYNSNIRGRADGLISKVNAAKNYNTFTKLGGGMDGTVKFIYKTSVADGDE